jgi:hypothetical protein
MTAIARYHKDRIVYLCPIGHYVTSSEFGRGYAGSMASAEDTKHSHGQESVYDRLAAECNGAGHPEEGDDYAPFQRCTRTANDGFRCHRESGHAGHCRSMEQS